MEDLRYTRYAEKKAGIHNKFYEVEAFREEGATHCEVIFRWGRIGTTGQEKRSTTLAWETAKRACDEQFEKKIKRGGYREACAMQALASAVETLEERKTNGLAPVELSIPYFGAGDSEDRCKQFARKWLDKLNLVRASKHDLGRDAYRKQAEDVLKGYRSEWARICSTQTHGRLVTRAPARDAAIRFFNMLREATELNYTYVCMV